MNNELRPGKGVQFPLTDETADWLSDVMYAVYEAFGTHTAYIREYEAEQELRSRLSEGDWTYSKDSYGHKMTIAYEFDDGSELRVAVVVNVKGELRLDIRTWFDPEVNA